MRSRLSVLVGAAVLLSVVSASAEAIWKIQDDGGKFTLKGVYLGQGVKAKFGVWPVAAGHSAGAVWTHNGWSSVHWTDASWCENVQGPYGGWDEHWLVAMFVQPTWTGGGPVDVNVNYALYVDNAAGERSWDNNGGMNYNYFIGQWWRSGDPSYLWNCSYWSN